MKQPLTILFNTYPVAFSCPGGGEVQLLKCKQALEAEGVRVLLFNQWDPQFDHVDVVHHFSVMAGSMNFCWHAHLKKLPLVISPILWLGENLEQYPLAEIGRLLELCDMALPNSIAEGKLLSKHFDIPETKFKPIVNGVDEIFLEKADPALFRQTHDIRKPFMLCVGNIEARKNQLELIRATKDIDMPLVLLGHIREPDYWEQCQTEAGDQVRWLGHLEYASDMHRSAYAACELFLLPSKLETPGLAALEAAAAGCKIVITDEGCTKEYFKEHAQYVHHSDTSSIKAGVKRALVQDESNDLATLICDNYTWKHSAKQLIAVYERLFANKLSS